MIEVPAGSDAPSLKVNGSTKKGNYLWGQQLTGEFHVHAVMRGDRSIDPDCCLGQVEGFLEERKVWAHDQEADACEWRLVPREGRKVTAVEALEAQTVEEREAAAAEREIERVRWEKWKSLTKDERQEMIRDELLDGALTASELADRLDDPEMRVYVERVRPLLKQMFDEGVLAREEERYRAGASIRYRYSLPDQDAA